MSQKPDAIRREMRARRANLSLTQVRSASERLLARLAQLPQLQQAEVIALYQPVRGEIDPRGLMLLWPEKTWVFPKVVSVENKTMHFYAPAGMEEMQAGAFGIAEPVASGRPWDDRVFAWGRLTLFSDTPAGGFNPGTFPWIVWPLTRPCCQLQQIVVESRHGIGHGIECRAALAFYLRMRD